MRARATPRLALDVLTTTLVLTLWVAIGSLVLAVASGLGMHPLRRVAIGIALVLATMVALWQRRRLCDALRRRPPLVLTLAALQIAAALLDGPVGSAYVAFSLTSVGFAVVGARARTVWSCVGLLAGAYLAGAWIQLGGLAGLTAAANAGGVIGAAIGYPVAAVLLLALRRMLVAVEARADASVLALRAGGGPRLLPAGEAVLPSTPRVAALSPREIEVIEALAAGRAPKQIALDLDVALATVRTHIRNAKKKTGSRTLRELSGLPSHPAWPEPGCLRD